MFFAIISDAACRHDPLLLTGGSNRQSVLGFVSCCCVTYPGVLLITHKHTHTRIVLSFSTDRVNGKYAGERKAKFLTDIFWFIYLMARLQQQCTEKHCSSSLHTYVQALPHALLRIR